MVKRFQVYPMNTPIGTLLERGNQFTDVAVSNDTPRKSDWPVISLCLCLSGFGMSAVPFIGTRYGDWPEAIALGLGLLPIVFVAIRIIIQFDQRLSNIERYLREIEAGRK